MRRLRSISGLLGLILLASAASAEPAVFVSKRLTPVNSFRRGIEGPAVDSAGNLFVVNFQENGDIGRLASGASNPVQFARLPAGSIGNGIRFDQHGRMYVADYKRHNIFVFEPGQATPRSFFHSENFAQPNDLAVGPDGTIYASDPVFSPAGGRVWRITRGADGTASGAPMTSDRPMKVPNGLDLSPDGGTLYVSESGAREIWAYRIDGTTLRDPRLVKRFDSGELDGLRTDLDGRIYVARLGEGKIAVVASDGTLVREITLLGMEPTNLTFGGADGRMVYVTQKDGRFVEAFRVDRPGREPCQQVGGAACAAE
jgi:signal peptidase